jgi:hypothetical protein
MRALQVLDLHSNCLTGSLLHEWGTIQKLPQSSWIDVSNNRLTGSGPQSFSWFPSGYISVTGNRLGGCLPDGVKVDLGDIGMRSCSDVSKDVTALLALKELLTGAVGPYNSGLSNWTKDIDGGFGGAGGFGPVVANGVVCFATVSRATCTQL